jgi:hypothetical protein
MQIFAHHRITAGKDEDGVAKLLDAINQTQRLLCVELIGICAVLGIGAAMNARKRAGTRHFPGNGERGLTEIRDFHALVMQVAFTGGSFGEV